MERSRRNHEQMKREHETIQTQPDRGEGCVCTDAGRAGRGRIARWRLRQHKTNNTSISRFLCEICEVQAKTLWNWNLCRTTAPKQNLKPKCRSRPNLWRRTITEFLKKTCTKSFARKKYHHQFYNPNISLLPRRRTNILQFCLTEILTSPTTHTLLFRTDRHRTYLHAFEYLLNIQENYEEW